MARAKKNPNTAAHIETAKAEASVIPVWQLRAIEGAFREYERTGSACRMYSTFKTCFGRGKDTLTMVSESAKLLADNADRLAAASGAR